MGVPQQQLNHEQRKALLQSYRSQAPGAVKSEAQEIASQVADLDHAIATVYEASDKLRKACRDPELARFLGDVTRAADVAREKTVRAAKYADGVYVRGLQTNLFHPQAGQVPHGR